MVVLLSAEGNKIQQPFYICCIEHGLGLMSKHDMNFFLQEKKSLLF